MNWAWTSSLLSSDSNDNVERLCLASRVAQQYTYRTFSSRSTLWGVWGVRAGHTSVKVPLGAPAIPPSLFVRLLGHTFLGSCTAKFHPHTPQTTECGVNAWTVAHVINPMAVCATTHFSPIARAPDSPTSHSRPSSEHYRRRPSLS